MKDFDGISLKMAKFLLTKEWDFMNLCCKGMVYLL